ncbi:germin-like protein 5-1 [Tanacetum coccineum]|uniref:Germin-like protein n=1 Tax=Tanacetum coccineum TaxID=301880 RepID=A0ABQ5D021_9ASTR
MARIDYALRGINPPHTHPRPTEIVFVLEGELDVGFITTYNKLFSKTVKVGEIFTLPRGLIHFQLNNKKVPAAVIAEFNIQFPGTQRVANALFASSPTDEDVGSIHFHSTISWSIRLAEKTLSRQLARSGRDVRVCGCDSEIEKW